MYSQYFGAVFLGAVTTCLVTAVVKLENEVIKPVVPMFCERLCNETEDCCSYVYRARDLSCHLNYIRSSLNGDQGQLIDDKDENLDLGNNTCQKDVKRGNCWPKEVPRTNMTRLLIISETDRDAQVLYLQNNSVVRYPFIMTRHVLAVAYISASRKLIISYHHGVFFAPLNSRNRTTIMERIYVTGIAVDDIKQLIFLSTRDYRGSVLKMSTSGQNVKVIKKNCDSKDIAVDLKRSMVYLSCQGVISKFTYNGSYAGIVVKNVISRDFFIYSERDFLYYVKRDNSQIVELALSDNKIRSVIRLDLHHVKDLYVAASHIFVGGIHRDIIMITANNTKTRIPVFRSFYGHGWVFCTIP